jgi:maltose O-acetyltransferase
MLRSHLIPHLMFDYEQLRPEDVKELCRELPLKLIRWIAINHPDNRSRLLYYQLTNVPIGEGTVINSGVKLYDEYKGLVSFGKRVAVASDVNIIASSNPNNSKLAEVPYVCEHLNRLAPVIIEDDAWIGAQVVILPGVTVGKGAIVGAGAVVVCDVAPHSAVAGVPARLIRTLCRPEDLLKEIPQ